MTTTSDRVGVSQYVAADLAFEPMAGESDFCARNAIGLFPARNHGWLIRAVESEGHQGAVLACIEDSEDQFELMQLVGGFRWSIHDSFHEALLRLVHELPQPGNERLFDNEFDPPYAATETALSLEVGHVLDDWIANIAPFPLEGESGL
jgi:hypothetical protein